MPRKNKRSQAQKARFARSNLANAAPVSPTTPPHQDKLRISSVYSVGGGQSYSVLSGGNGDGSVDPLVRCSGCSKVLLKGQMAVKRKDSNQLFCSSVCLTAFLPPSASARTCHLCLKNIENPMNVPQFVVNDNLTDMLDFCSFSCLTAFRCKKMTDPPLAPELAVCIICRKSNEVQHEVTYQGELHRLCSDDCFFTWRRNLALNCCKGCGMYCSSKGGGNQSLTIGDATLSFCSPTCISIYKRVAMDQGPSNPPSPSNPGSSRPYGQQELTPPSPSHIPKPIMLDKCCFQEPSFNQEPSIKQEHQERSIKQEHQEPSFTQELSFSQEQQEPSFNQEDQEPSFNQEHQEPSFKQEPSFNQEPSLNAELFHRDKTETDALNHHRKMKNKAITCRPFTNNQETLCNLPTQPTQTAAVNEEKVKVLPLPIPVPVFIPVPMSLYCQYTPVPMPMAVPVPVPVVLLSAPRGSQSKDINDPVLQSQGIAEEVQEAEKDKPVSHGDQGSTYSGDMESEAISSPLSLEEESTLVLGARDLEVDIPTERCDPSERPVLRTQQRLAGRKRTREGFSPTECLYRQQTDIHQKAKRLAIDIGCINTPTSMDAVQLKKAEFKSQLMKQLKEAWSPRATVQVATDELIKTLEETRKALDESQLTMDETWTALDDSQSIETRTPLAEIQDEASTENQEDNGTMIRPPSISPDSDPNTELEVGTNIHPDIDIPVLTPDVEQVINKLSWGCRVRYISLLFRLVVTEKQCEEWGRNTNWEGSSGKWALPSNLRQFIMDAITKKFPTIHDKEGTFVKDRVNEYLLKTGSCSLPI